MLEVSCENRSLNFLNYFFKDKMPLTENKSEEALCGVDDSFCLVVT